MSYSEVKNLTTILQEKLDKYDIPYKTHHSMKSPSTYIKITRKMTIRISDHYSSTDFYCEYNIGYHVQRFKKFRKSMYYKGSNYNMLIKRVVKDYRDKYSGRCKSCMKK